MNTWLVVSFVSCTIAIFCAFGQVALLVLRMRNELRLRDAEGCRHGHGPDGKRRDGRA